MKRFPWARAMEIGLGHLRLAPDQFWRMTLPELAAAMRRQGAAPETLTRRDFEFLREKFPD